MLLFRHETDELRREIHQLVNTMTEKDGRMKELEERIQETLTEEERHSHLKKEQILREQVHKGSSWVFVDPLKANLSLEKTAFAKQDDETLSTAELRRKIDELQRRITEVRDGFSVLPIYHHTSATITDCNLSNPRSPRLDFP